MKITCQRKDLLEAIVTSAGAVSGKSPAVSNSSLEGLLLSAREDGSVYVTGSDLLLSIRCLLPAAVEEKGAVVLNARLLIDIVRTLPEALVEIAALEDFTVTVKCGPTEFTLIGLSEEKYPHLPQIEKKKGLVLKQAVLKSMISQTIFAVSDNESKPVHMGSLFELADYSLTVVSVDGYRLAMRKETIERENPGESASFVVPGAALKEVEKILEDTEDSVFLYPDKKHILFSIGDVTVTSRLLEGEFLNYRNAIPEDIRIVYEVNRKEMIDSVGRVSLIISERLKNPVRCVFSEGVLKLSCITAMGKSYDECAVSGAEEEVEIGFNNRYLTDALRACPDEKVNVCLKSGLAPCVIRPLEGEKYLHLVLPVRLKANE